MGTLPTATRELHHADDRRGRLVQTARAGARERPASRSLPLLAACCFVLALAHCSERVTHARNLLLITVDTLRADHLSSYGYARETSPTLDRLAAEGVRFGNPIVQRGGTWPSLTSILTSMYPSTHGVRHNGDRLDASKRTIAEFLRHEGFTTAAILTNMMTAPNRGFDYIARIDRDGEESWRDDAAEQSALQWLRDHRDEKFFLWLHLMGPHAPYHPSHEFQRKFDTGYIGPLNGSIPGLSRIHEQKERLSAEELAHLVSLYDAEISQADARIERILRQLSDLGLARNTLVVFVSDHGEELYQHNSYFFHSWSIYDSVLRVPLILWLPGLLPAGKNIDAIVESIDLAPTLFELLNVPVPESFQGTSLVDLIFEDAGASVDSREAFSELGPYIHSLRTDRWHYIYNPRLLSSPGSRDADPGRNALFRIAREELYDVLEDPEQKNNLAKANPMVAAELRDRLLTWIGSEPSTYHPQELSPETHEELKALGYLE